MTRSGLHHVTAISGPARGNLAFYAGVLGLRLVKRTVNFDDPGTYHLYYGDEAGSAGTLLTFFPWDRTAPGLPGAGQAEETAFRVPDGALGYWADRLAGRCVRRERFGEGALAFSDPDGTRLALVAVPGAEAGPAWTGGGIPAEHAIRGLHGVTLTLAEAAPAAAILTDVLGFSEAAREGAVLRVRAEGAAQGGVVDLHETSGQERVGKGRMGVGSVHHVAFRAADDAAQATMARRLAERHGVRATEQKDRDYFRSVYFREPGGVLFEIATDIPGFAVDEPLAALGSSLKLPRSLEPRRREIEEALPAIA